MKVLDADASFAMLCDFYEFTMTNGFMQSGLGDKICYFDMYFRKVPDGGGMAIAAGLAQVVEFISALRFSEDDLLYLRGKGVFCEQFLDYLRDFRFECDVWAVPEGTPMFPGEPMLTVRGPAMQAQLLETMLLLLLNHQTLIATKANRIVRAARGRSVVEFGARRAQGVSAALYGARAAYIGGCDGSSCALAEQRFGVPAAGTMAHSWVQMFPSELDAFREYARLYPDNCLLLVDTYNTLKSGVPNAIRAFDEVLAPKGIRPRGIRIDSGDLAYLSRRARGMLDAAGYTDCKIMASNSLDEYIIRDTIIQGAAIDMFGVGERLITSSSAPAFGGIYKLVAVQDPGGPIVPKIKISENINKMTVPGFKSLYRLFDRDNGKAIADVVCMHGEVIDDSAPYEIFDPNITWKRKTVTNFTAHSLLERIYDKGRLVYDCPPVAAIRDYCSKQVDSIWDEVKRFENPHGYYVDLSQSLWDVRQALLTSRSLK